MQSTYHRSFGLFGRLAVLVGVIVASFIATDAADCTAEIQGSLFGNKESKHYTQYVWKVDITTREKCAKVQFVLNYTETDREGNDSSYRVPMVQKIRDGSTTSRKVSHRIATENTMSEWRFEVSSCEPCNAP